MRRTAAVSLLFWLVGPGIPPIHAASLPASVDVCFTPAQSCAGRIVAAIDAAQSTIRVQAYSFTSTVIAKAMVEAKQRGVDISVILDRSQRSEKYSSATFLYNFKFPVLIDSRVSIAHNKIIVIDGQLVISGSYNFTKAAEDRNAENVIFIKSKDLARAYLANWDSRAILSAPYHQ